MSVPINQQDYERFLKLAAAIKEVGIGEISIYTGHQRDRNGGGCYAHIELSTSALPAGKLEEIFKCASLPFAPKPALKEDY
jgi:hypothetical protein